MRLTIPIVMLVGCFCLGPVQAQVTKNIVHCDLSEGVIGIAGNDYTITLVNQTGERWVGGTYCHGDLGECPRQGSCENNYLSYSGNGEFFLIVGEDGVQEGSYGRDSGGAERPEDSTLPTCDRPQNLANSCG